MAAFGVHISRKTTRNMRRFLDGFRTALADSEDPYKKGQHDAFDFMIKQIDQNLEREDF
jgi:hypothetical protein